MTEVQEAARAVRLKEEAEAAAAQQAGPTAVSPDDLLTIEEYCARERISRSTFLRMRQRGKCPACFRVGGQWRISVAAADAYREASRVAGVEAA